MNKTINNPNGVAVEETVMLDTNRANRSQVKIIGMTPNNMFSYIYPATIENPTENDCWQVMTNRLSKI